MNQHVAKPREDGIRWVRDFDSTSKLSIGRCDQTHAPVIFHVEECGEVQTLGIAVKKVKWGHHTWTEGAYPAPAMVSLALYRPVRFNMQGWGEQFSVEPFSDLQP